MTIDLERVHHAARYNANYHGPARDLLALVTELETLRDSHTDLSPSERHPDSAAPSFTDAQIDAVAQLTFESLYGTGTWAPAAERYEQRVTSQGAAFTQGSLVLRHLNLAVQILLAAHGSPPTSIQE